MSQDCRLSALLSLVITLSLVSFAHGQTTPQISCIEFLLADHPSSIVPGQLPIEQPTTITLSINFTTAQLLGIDVPQSRLLQADELQE